MASANLPEIDECFLPFALPEIGEEEIAEVVDTMLSGWLTTGPKTKRFEELFASYVGSKNGIAVNSGTAGLHLALEACGVGPGDKVITTPYTFTATAEVARYLGADPIFVDICADSFNLDIQELRRTLEQHPEVKVILPVHFAGQACDMDEILALAKQYDCKVVEDAAHALPARYKGQMIGTLGDITVYSFYATKTITVGEGGMVVTNDDAIADRIRTMRLHGINRDVFNRYTSDKPSWYYEVVAPGYKYNMTDIAASIGLHQLAKADEFQQRRQTMAELYNEAFADLPVRVPVQLRNDDTHSWHLYVVQLELEKLTINRDQFIQMMADSGIGTSVHFIPLHMQPYWRDRYHFNDQSYPVAADVFSRVVSLPLYTKMTDADQHRVVLTVREILLANMK